MNRKLLGGVLMLCGVAAAASCAMDDRAVQVVLSLGADAGAAGPGSVAAARLEVDPASADLGWVTVGYPARSRLSITNTGGSTLALPSIGLAAGSEPDFQIIHNQCAAELPPGKSCDVRVQLIPSRTGATSARVHVESAGAPAVEVTLTAEGLAPGSLILAPAAGFFEDFAAVRLGESVPGLFTVTNPSATPSGVLSFRSNRPEFAIVPSGAPGECVVGSTSLVNGESCSLPVSFNPTLRGPVEAVLTGRSEGAGGISTTLAGRGLAPGSLVAATAQLSFEGVVLGEGMARSMSFRNDGDEPLTLTGASLSPGAEGFAILSSDCGPSRSLAPASSCTVQIEFRPPRTAEELNGELWVDALEGQQRQVVPLRGLGLGRGGLTVTPLTPGEENFGNVLLGASEVRSFQVQNPTPQPSGALAFITSDGFGVEEPPGAGECAPGITSLVDGQSCSLRVRFTPPRRELLPGAVTVSSELAGAKSLALSGTGVMPATFEVASEINFGRVFTNASASRTVTLTNAGDETLAPPALELTSTSAPLAGAFVYQSGCAAPLASGESCDITVQLTPRQPVPHSATLQLVSAPGGSTSILLLAEALAPGSLVLAAAEGGTGDFGDAEIGASVTQIFSVNNPGPTPSGLLTIRSDSSRFEVLEGDCNPPGSAGLANGEACSFGVRFTPNDSVEVVANLSVQSPGAGQAGLEVRGRGRGGATLVAAGAQNLGRANVGQTTLTQPENEFIWTVQNEGDLPSGVLVVTNDNPTEFVRGTDTCDAVSLAGGSTCSITIRFTPSTTGARSATIVVQDPTSDRSATVLLTATGVVLAQPGESCVNAECASGECTGGVCCDRPCDGACQVCSAAGVCADQSAQEPCGSGNGRCFGVNQCLIPNGLACSQSLDCASVNCERRLGGLGVNDRICCTTDCGAALQCNAQASCQEPALGDGVACGAPGNAPCGAGLECKACQDGGNRCTPADECCDACTGGRSCQNGVCGCPNGQTFVNGQCSLPQGATCQAAGAPCATGQCVDGVCCESLCQGLCTQCQAGTGRCIAPVDDDLCPEVACSTGESCRVADAIATNRCRAPGQCKTAADCTDRPAPARTACGPGEDTGVGLVVPLCGATGCVNPQVNCQGVTDTVTGTNCCQLDFPESSEPVGFVTTSDCVGGSGSIGATCDSENDCPLNSACCLTDFGNFNYITCSADCQEEANPDDPTGTGVYLVCRSPGGGTSSCPGGRPCDRIHPELAGWTFCRLP